MPTLLLLLVSLVATLLAIPFPADFCGVVDGSDDCFDCFGNAHGTFVRDSCGVCNGGNICGTCAYHERDVCGVCFGDGGSCVDCFGTPYGRATYDACGVCGALGETCRDCNGIVLGTSTYDVCGVCNGNHVTCNDCLEQPFGTAVYDRCDVCGGDNACVDCAGEPNGLAAYDACDVCDGDGSSCIDCAGVVNGSKVFNACGQCIERSKLLDKHGHKIACLDEALAEELEHQMALYVTLVVFSLLACFILAILFAVRIGAILSRFFWSVFSRSSSAVLPAPRTTTTLGPGGGGGGGGGGPGGTVVMIATILTLLSTGAHAFTLTPSQMFLAEMCDNTNIGTLIPGSCRPFVNACTSFAPFVTCQESPADTLIRRVNFDTLHAHLGGVIFPSLFAHMRSANSVSIRGRSVAHGETNVTLQQLTFVNFSRVDFSTFVNLQVLRISSSRFNLSGLPHSIGQMPKLQTLSITDSDLGGTVIADICHLAQLRKLELIGTRLTGPSFCAEAFAMRELTTIDLSNNKLTGELVDFSALSNLKSVRYDNNQLGDTLSPAVLPPALLQLYVRHNQYSNIVLDWSAIANIHTFFISHNLFTGQMPHIALANAYYIDVSHNMFDTYAPGLESHCPYTILDVSYNELGGPMPHFASVCILGMCHFDHNPICDSNNVSPVVFEQCSLTLAPDACCDATPPQPDCLDCNGTPFGTATYDACDICNGDGRLCVDCRGVLFGTSRYDTCDVCAGDNSACRDCEGVPNGGAAYDACDVCNGNSNTCSDCSGAPHGPFVIDGCGKCVLPPLANLSCQDCNGVVNGTSLFDELGECNGNGRSDESPLARDLEDSQGAFWWLLFLFVFSVFSLCLLAFAVVTCTSRLRQ